MNNAGIDLYGDVELLTMDLYRKVADVNLWGTIHVTKVFLPLIRKSKGIEMLCDFFCTCIINGYVIEIMF